MLDKNRIIALKEAGYSYKEIASELGIPVGSVKSVISRASTEIKMEIDTPKCKNCGCEITLVKGKRKREFCSDKCRRMYWLNHLEKRVCKFCNNTFIPNSKSNQVFCSKECYLKSRNNGGVSNECK